MCVRSVCVCVAVYGMVTVAKVKVAVKIMCCAYVEQHVATNLPRGLLLSLHGLGYFTRVRRSVGKRAFEGAGPGGGGGRESCKQNWQLLARPAPYPRQRRRPRQVRRPRQGCAARASGAARANGAAQGVARPRFSSSPRGRRLPAASFLVQQRMRSTN
jgi:hypothetical protein